MSIRNRVPAIAKVSRRAIDREVRALTQSDRLNALGRWLEHGPTPVRTTSYHQRGQRVTLLLDGSNELTLRLYWRRDADITELVSIRHDERIGWIAVGRTGAHQHVVFYAWLASLRAL